MRICSVSGWSGKNILGFFAIGLAGTYVPIASGQTTNWNGNAGNVWTRNLSWSSGSFPDNTGSIAVISGGSGGAIELREINNPGTNSVGTIIVTNPSYGALTGANNDTEATISFGSTSAITVDLSTDSAFIVGNEITGGAGLVTLSIPGALAVNVQDGQELQFLTKAIGNGSISI